MRIGWFGAAALQSAPPTLVWTPSSPSTQAIGVGHPPPTTAPAAARSIFWLVNGGPPPGKIPSICTSRLTFLRTSPRPSSELPCPGLDASRPATFVYPPTDTMVTL